MYSHSNRINVIFQILNFGFDARTSRQQITGELILQ